MYLFLKREGMKKSRDQIGRDFTEPGGISITPNTDGREKYLWKRKLEI